MSTNLDAACSDHGCNNQSVVLIKIEWNGPPVSKRIENPPVVAINNSLAVIGFNEMTQQNMGTMMIKRAQTIEITINPRKSASPSQFKIRPIGSNESFHEHYSYEWFIQRMSEYLDIKQVTSDNFFKKA
ncbi:hypothetical protein AVEN_117121-1 [Araneus ventricosus]|uniref:Uncharacterized protein n=1 Tax=Araneus ventricosus TaxID=182803 RepID=A0A4Y2KAI5_ARAVE|nr:hypothetical protein AVEN_117121-1 [Araneus ventricosus]